MPKPRAVDITARLLDAYADEMKAGR